MWYTWWSDRNRNTTDSRVGLQRAERSIPACTWPTTKQRRKYVEIFFRKHSLRSYIRQLVLHPFKHTISRLRSGGLA